ncbi:MAG: TIGR04053 family radical SAM/SPASM domain-containing protein [Euryarchaeota archaeon]|nr:TIGR04053 family radical SAM/SPASM domain-containing protein [Euryarchaeota archaeon]
MNKKPISIMWESTIACGLACKHCKASAKKTPDPDELSTEEAMDLVDQMVEFGKPYPILRITGGNALMRDDIFEIIKCAKGEGLNVTIAPSTTPLLNRENITKLKEAGTDVVAISIDGADAESHDNFRGVKGTFDTMVKATQIMNDVKLPFRLLTTVTKFNVRNLPEIFLLSKRLGAIGWYLYMLIPTGRGKIEHGISPAEFEDVFNFIYDLMKYRVMTINAIAGSEPFRRVAIMRRLVEEGKLNEEVLRLGELYRFLKNKLDNLLSSGSFEKIEVSAKKKHNNFGKGIFVSRNGSVYPSSFMPIEIGNVLNDRLAHIYASAEILRDLNNTKKLKGRCGICEFNDVCRGSRSRAYAVTGDYLAEDPYCAYQPGTVGKREGNEAILQELRVTNFSRQAPSL